MRQNELYLNIFFVKSFYHKYLGWGDFGIFGVEVELCTGAHKLQLAKVSTAAKRLQKSPFRDNTDLPTLLKVHHPMDFEGWSAH